MSSSGSLDITRSILISIVIAVGSMVFTTMLAVFGGYGLARLKFPGANVVFFMILITFMIPFQAVITPLYLVLAQLNLTNSLLGVILVIGTFQLPFGLFIMRISFTAVPRSLEEAAMIDGCGILATLRRVMLPMALPGILTTALFGFFAGWNEFFAPLILLTNQKLYPLTVTLSILQTGQEGTLNWGVLQAGVVLTIAPCILLFIFLQRYYVSGLVSGAIK
ncbi:carbohydrate ABC transporter permease [Glaciibacter superstes]|uniref:carbohydrate ABC transporter permease n=1 Tax=Glaciibacter superstes TaxID=501023 RepID=UPI001FE17FDC|nr:carbohydrate ABC transporter permease [Glaciibacter superstes]